MGLTKSPLKFNPFSRLDRKIEPRRPAEPLQGPVAGEMSSPEDGNSVFLDAMEGVRPLAENRKIGKVSPKNTVLRNSVPEAGDSEEVRKLVNLVLKGEGFSVADTPEYIEGTGYNVRPDITRRLHQGDFSIQAHLDLHGHTSSSARQVFEDFMRRSIYSGKRAVLVIHGRGLSSPGEPVLKAKMLEWLTRSAWRKWVIAFASARAHDGGAGATYILLRERPVSKKMRKSRTMS